MTTSNMLMSQDESLAPNSQETRVRQGARAFAKPHRFRQVGSFVEAPPATADPSAGTTRWSCQKPEPILSARQFPSTEEIQAPFLSCPTNREDNLRITPENALVGIPAN